MTPELLHFRISHYNEKVRWALDFKGWPHRRRALIPGFHKLSGHRQLPVLRLNGKALADSTAIIAEIERLRPDPPLYPADPQERARALALEDHFDEAVAPDLRRLFWSCYVDHPASCARMATDGFGGKTRLAFRMLWPAMRPLFIRNMRLDAASVRRSLEALAGHFERLEAAIQPDGYLVGGRFTVADLTAASVMTAILRPPEFSYPLPEPWPHELVELRRSVADRPGAAWVRDIYLRHRGVTAEAS